MGKDDDGERRGRWFHDLYREKGEDKKGLMMKMTKPADDQRSEEERKYKLGSGWELVMCVACEDEWRA